MRREIMCSVALASALLLCPLVGPAGAEQVSGDPIQLSVLYAGYPENPRYKDFVELLEKHFTKVGKTDLAKFQEKDVEGYDVAVLDYGELIVRNNTIQSPDVPFAKSYSRPTITIGATGAMMCDRMNLKTGYL